MADYYERRKAIKAFVESAITPLLEGVVVQKLMQAGESLRSEMKQDPLDWSLVATPASILAAEDGGGAVADPYIGWARYEDFNGARPTVMKLCDSDARGAFKIYAAHPSQAGVREVKP